MGLHLKRTDSFTLPCQQDESQRYDSTVYPNGDQHSLSRIILSLHSRVISIGKSYRRPIYRCFAIIFLLCYSAYFAYAIYLDFQKNIALFVLTILCLTFLLGKLGCSKVAGVFKKAYDDLNKLMSQGKYSKWKYRLPWIMYILCWLAVTSVVISNVVREPERAISCGGLVILILISFLTSKNQTKVNWNLVNRCMLAQFFLGLLFLRWQPGADAVRWIGDQFTTFLNYRRAGESFVFGPKESDNSYAMQTITVVFYFGAVLNILSYLGLTQRVVAVVGRVISLVTGAGTVASFVAAANIFTGGDTATLLVAPLVERMTPSEIHNLLTCGIASISISTLAIFVSFGVPGEWLVSAAVMSAPASLAVANLMHPETQETAIADVKHIEFPKQEERNLIEAASNGATRYNRMYAYTLATVIAFLSLVEFFNSLIGWLGDRVGVEGLTFQMAFSYLFYPLMVLMGVDIRDVMPVGEMIGVSIFVSGILSNFTLGTLIRNRKMGLQPSLKSIRSEVIATYANSKFGNITVMAAQTASICAICPSRRGDITGLALRSLVAGNIAAFMTASIAGLLY